MQAGALRLFAASTSSSFMWLTTLCQAATSLPGRGICRLVAKHCPGSGGLQYLAQFFGQDALQIGQRLVNGFFLVDDRINSLADLVIGNGVDGTRRVRNQLVGLGQRLNIKTQPWILVDI